MITTRVAAGDVREGDFLYIARDRITVGRCQRRRASRKHPPRVAFYPRRPDGAIDSCAAVTWPVTKTVRLDPTSPSLTHQEHA